MEGIDAKDGVSCQTETLRKRDAVVILFLEKLDVAAVGADQTLLAQIHGAAPFMLQKYAGEGTWGIFRQQQITFDPEPWRRIEKDRFLSVFPHVFDFENFCIEFKGGDRIIHPLPETVMCRLLPFENIFPFFRRQIAGACLTELCKTIFHDVTFPSHFCK